jgi:hypothetical protein
MNQHADAETFTALHSQCLADDGTPALSSRFVRYLDGGPGATRRGAPVVPLTLDEARARLAQEHPELAAAVDLCCVQGHTARLAAQLLDVTAGQVYTRKRAGIAQLAVWSDVSVGYVESYCTHRVAS